MKRAPRRKPSRYEIRELRASDLENGFFETLGNLSELEGLTVAKGRKILSDMKRGTAYNILVAVAPGGQVIGTTTLLVEQKFIHGGGLVGHIEDVAVRKGFEGKGVGSSLVRRAIGEAKELGCYKCILDCSPGRVGFYEAIGLVRHEVGMRVDLKGARKRPR